MEINTNKQVPVDLKEEKNLISIIVPCYNESRSIDPYYNEMAKVFLEMNEVDFELIFIDDGSVDTTLDSIKKIKEDDKRVGYISFSRNFGKENAMLAGFEKCRGNYISVMDVDF